MCTTRRYFLCCTSRCTSTTIVFSILALVTLPVRMVLSPRSATGALCVSVVITLSLLSALAREPVFSHAPDLFSLREGASALPPGPSKAGTADGISSPSNPSAAPAVRPRPLRESFQYAAAWLKPSRAGNEFRGDRQFVRRQPHGFLGRRFVHSRHFEHDASWLHHRYPLFRRAFALAHARFRRLLGERLIRKNPDPQFSAALDEARDRHARSFNLPVGDPRALHGFQSVFTECQITAAPGFAFAAPAHLLSVLHFLRHQHRCILASLISLTAFCLRYRSGFAFLLNLRKLLRHVFALVDPALHANHSVRGVRFRGAVVDVRSQCLQWQPPLQVPFLARDFSAVQASGYAHFDAFAAEAQRRIHRFAHRAPERHALFQLQRNRFRHQRGIQLRTMNFLDVDVHFTLGALLHVLLQLVNFRAFAPDDDARPRGIDAHDEFVRRALDVDRADARALQFFFQLLAELYVFVKKVCLVLVGIPPRLERLVVTQPESVRVRFLSHSRSPYFLAAVSTADCFLAAVSTADCFLAAVSTADYFLPFLGACCLPVKALRTRRAVPRTPFCASASATLAATRSAAAT